MFGLNDEKSEMKVFAWKSLDFEGIVIADDIDDAAKKMDKNCNCFANTFLLREMRGTNNDGIYHFDMTVSLNHEEKTRYWDYFVDYRLRGDECFDYSIKHLRGKVSDDQGDELLKGNILKWDIMKNRFDQTLHNIDN